MPVCSNARLVVYARRSFSQTILQPAHPTPWGRGICLRHADKEEPAERGSGEKERGKEESVLAFIASFVRLVLSQSLAVSHRLWHIIPSVSLLRLALSSRALRLVACLLIPFPLPGRLVVVSFVLLVSVVSLVVLRAHPRLVSSLRISSLLPIAIAFVPVLLAIPLSPLSSVSSPCPIPVPLCPV